MPIEVEQVEGEVSEGLFDALLEGGLQVGEAGRAVGGQDDEFGVLAVIEDTILGAPPVLAELELALAERDSRW